MNCNECPNIVRGADAPAILGRQIGADVCGVYGHMLSRPTATWTLNDATKAAFASACPSYGDKQAFKDPAPVIGYPDPDCLTPSDPDLVGPTTCLSCANFVAPTTVRSELGWSLGLCKAKGKLLFQQWYTREASECGLSVEGPNATTTTGVTPLPAYGIDHAVFVRAAAATTTSTPVTVGVPDPRTRETDRPVTARHEQLGVRAWEKVLDPEGFRDPAWLPIFRDDVFAGNIRETYGSHRPELYLDHAGVVYDMVRIWLDMQMTPIVIGSAGTGKTELFCHLAYRMNLPFYRKVISSGTEDYMLAGEKNLETVDVTTTDEFGMERTETHVVTVFKPADFLLEIQTPCVEVVDEPNLQEKIMQFVRPLLDGGHEIVIKEAQPSYHAKKHPFCFLGAAQNPSWDPIYVGTAPMSAADMDRVLPIQMDLPSRDIEIQIIKAHCLDAKYDITDETIRKIMDITKDIRQAIADGNLQIAWGLRSQIKVARATQFFSLAKAYRRALLDGLEQQQADTVMAFVGTA